VNVDLSSHYEIVLAELKLKREKLAKKYIPKLYRILRNEEHLPSEECRAKVQRDCGDMWAEDTIRKHLPAEAKNEVRRRAGKISAEVKKRQRDKESLSTNVGNFGESSFVLRTNGDGDNFVGLNPTENGSVGRKEQESRTFRDSDTHLTFKLSLLDNDVWDHMVDHHIGRGKGSLLWITGVINTQTRKIVSASIDCHSSNLD
jgi:hypothetical protein